MAQRLLVERKDTSIKKKLIDFVLAGNNDLGSLHALWTLEGMNMLDPEVLLTLLSDQIALVWPTALRLLEPWAQKDTRVREQLEEVLLKEWEKAPIEHVLQMALSARVLHEKVSHTLLAGIVERYDTSALLRDAVLSSLYNQEFAFLKRLWQAPQWQQHQPSREIFLEMLTSAIIRKRETTELTELLTLLDVKKEFSGWRQKAVLTAMSIAGTNTKAQPIRLATAPGILNRSGYEKEPSYQAALAALFEWPGHMAAKNTLQKKNILNEEEQKLFTLGRQHYLTTCAGCHGTDGAGLNRFAPPLAGSGWVTGDEKRLALIILHGMEGPVEVAGKVYNTPDILPVMPAHTTMDDATITAILTYIRNEWGNDAGPVSKRTVGTTRNTSQGRVVPWTVAELDKYMLESKAASGK
jgi:mono/diheme cytochrome c family protein